MLTLTDAIRIVKVGVIPGVIDSVDVAHAEGFLVGYLTRAKQELEQTLAHVEPLSNREEYKLSAVKLHHLHEKAKVD